VVLQWYYSGVTVVLQGCDEVGPSILPETRTTRVVLIGLIGLVGLVGLIGLVGLVELV
jgi:hypothetical protein